MKQKIMTVRFNTNTDGMYAQFWPFMNASQIKSLEERMAVSTRTGFEMLETDIKKVMEIKDLEQMNRDGWQLQNIQIIQEHQTKIPHQIAIFNSYIEFKEMFNDRIIEGKYEAFVDGHEIKD